MSRIRLAAFETASWLPSAKPEFLGAILAEIVRKSDPRREAGEDHSGHGLRFQSADIAIEDGECARRPARGPLTETNKNGLTVERPLNQSREALVWCTGTIAIGVLGHQNAVLSCVGLAPRDERRRVAALFHGGAPRCRA